MIATSVAIAKTKSLFGMYDCTLDSSVDTHVRSHVPPSTDWFDKTLKYRYRNPSDNKPKGYTWFINNIPYLVGNIVSSVTSFSTLTITISTYC